MLWFETALTPNRWARNVRIEVSGGMISHIQEEAAVAPGDEKHAIALPGLCNLHSHAFQRGMAGLAEKRGPAHDDFWTWREIMYRFLDHLTPDDVEAISGLAYVEMLESGFTRVGEFHYLHHDPKGFPYSDLGEMGRRIAASADETRIGLTLLPVFYAHANFGGVPPSAGQRRFVNDLDSYARLAESTRAAIACLPDAKQGLAPHSLRAVTPEELSEVLLWADGGPVHIHAAEQTKEVADCVAWCGRRPVEWLLGNAEVNRAWCLVHATHMTEHETVQLAESGAVAGLCPVTEANLGDGVFPAETYLAARGHFGVGTDSNVRISAAEELRSAEYAQRLTHRARNLWEYGAGISTGRALFQGALSGGSQALGLHEAGIKVGAHADLISLDADDPALVARKGDEILDSWIFGSGRISCVWRRGQKVVDSGRHIRRPDVERRYRQTIRRLLSSA